jgi:TrmH family RNA methyltransferase
MTKENYQEISSPQNNQIKLLQKLNLKKYRQATKQFLVENLAIISDALKAGHDFDALFVTPEFAAQHSDKLAEWRQNSHCLNFYQITAKLNKLYSNLDTPSGITAVYNLPKKKLTDATTVYLNGISDPGNLGTILRSALAFGFDNLVLDKNCVDLYNPKVVSAAKDAIFKLHIHEDKDGSWLKKTKLPIYTTSSHSGRDLGRFKAAKAFCLVLGSESHGVSPELMDRADQSLKIPISDQIESLNVATAAAILFYELHR